MQEMTLKEVCKKLGVTRRAVQGYEKAGLVSFSGKNKYGYLLYDEFAIEKIRIIKKYQDFGFVIREIKELLVASDEIYVDMMKERVATMKKELERLENNIQMAEIYIQERAS